MSQEKYIVITPSGAELTLASEVWTEQQITTAQREDNTYADHSASVALASAKEYANDVVSNRLAELLPAFPEPTPPATGYGALEVWKWFYPEDTTKRNPETDGKYLVFRDETYVNAIGHNAASTAITEAHAFTLIKTDEVKTSADQSCQSRSENSLASANLYTDQTKYALLDDISDAIQISERYTDTQLEKQPRALFDGATSQGWDFLGKFARNLSNPELPMDAATKLYSDTKDNTTLTAAKEYTDTEIAQIVSDNFTFDQFLTYVDRMDAN